MAPPIEYVRTALNTKYIVIILTVYIYIYIALKLCISHKTSMACFSPAHEYTSSQILHIYGLSVVICGGLPTRLAAANHHKPPPKHRKYAGIGTKGIRESIVFHRHRVLARDQSGSLEDWQKLARTGEIVWFYDGRDRKKTGKIVRNGHFGRAVSEYWLNPCTDTAWLL